MVAGLQANDDAARSLGGTAFPVGIVVGVVQSLLFFLMKVGELFVGQMCRATSELTSEPAPRDKGTNDKEGDDVDEVDNSASAEDNHILLVLPRGARFARAACVRVAAERWRRTVRTRARLPEQRHAPNQGLQMVCASNTRTSLAAEI